MRKPQTRSAQSTVWRERIMPGLPRSERGEVEPTEISRTAKGGKGSASPQNDGYRRRRGARVRRMAAQARFGIVFLPESLTAFGALCRDAEGHGFDWLGVADSQSVFRELYVALSLAALNTSRARVCPLVTNPLTRHLVVTACPIARATALSGRRALPG